MIPDSENRGAKAPRKRCRCLAFRPVNFSRGSTELFRNLHPSLISRTPDVVWDGRVPSGSRTCSDSAGMPFGQAAPQRRQHDWHRQRQSGAAAADQIRRLDKTATREINYLLRDEDNRIEKTPSTTYTTLMGILTSAEGPRVGCLGRRYGTRR